MLETLQAVLAIVVIDLALSGDNALVIGMAARGLPNGQRRTAIAVGAGGAVALRVVLAAIATVLLTVPYLQLAGGFALALIAYRFVRPGNGHAQVRPGARSLREAVGLILIADLAMSLENVLGVAGAAHGNIPLLLFGLALSIPIVMVGSGLIASLLDRFPQIVWLGAGTLAWTAAGLIIGDPAVPIRPSYDVELALAVTLLVAIYVLQRIERRRLDRPTAALTER